MLTLKSACIEPQLYIVNARSRTWELQLFEEIGIGNVGGCTEVLLIEFVVSTLVCNLYKEFLVDSTSDVHSTEAILLTLDERGIPSKVRWREVHRGEVDLVLQLTLRTALCTDRSYPYPVTSRSKVLLHIDGHRLATQKELVGNYIHELSDTALINGHGYECILGNIRPLRCGDFFLLREETKGNLCRISRSREIEVEALHPIDDFHLPLRTREVKHNPLCLYARISTKPSLLVLGSLKEVDCVGRGVKVGVSNPLLITHISLINTFLDKGLNGFTRVW